MRRRGLEHLRPGRGVPPRQGLGGVRDKFLPWRCARQRGCRTRPRRAPTVSWRYKASPRRPRNAIERWRPVTASSLDGVSPRYAVTSTERSEASCSGPSTRGARRTANDGREPVALANYRGSDGLFSPRRANATPLPSSSLPRVSPVRRISGQASACLFSSAGPCRRTSGPAPRRFVVHPALATSRPTSSALAALIGPVVREQRALELFCCCSRLRHVALGVPKMARPMASGG